MRKSVGMRASQLADALGVSRALVCYWERGVRVIDDAYVPRIRVAIETYEPPAPDAWFWKHVAVGAPDDCWEWQSFRNCHGYGQCRHDKRQQVAHRWSWEIAHGPIPTGAFICHRCDNPPCVNPAHLFLGDALVNVRDMLSKGRDRFHFQENRPKGDLNAHAKLTGATVRRLRAEYAEGGVTQKELAVRYSISPALVNFIITGRAWQHITHGVHALQG